MAFLDSYQLQNGSNLNNIIITEREFLDSYQLQNGSNLNNSIIRDDILRRFFELF